MLIALKNRTRKLIALICTASFISGSLSFTSLASDFGRNLNFPKLPEITAVASEKKEEIEAEPEILNSDRTPLNYSDEKYWIAKGEGGTEKKADVFWICPSISGNEEGNVDYTQDDYNLFKKEYGVETPVFTETARIYAPFYRQLGLLGYEKEGQEEKLRKAYTDVSAAFRYYLDNENNGRPLILAGFSQGADMCYRILQEYYGGDSKEAEDLRNNLVAVYALGWAMTSDMIEEYPWIRPAKGEKDTGVVVSYECEDDRVEGLSNNLIIHNGERMLSINPLNWRTDDTKADKSLNKGTYKSREGNTGKCGAYIDPVRGSLKITDLKGKFSNIEFLMKEGSLHLYDISLMKENIKENVKVRVDAFLSGNDGFITSVTQTIREGKPYEPVNLRFYDDAPSIPYISISEFYERILPGAVMKIEKEGDGTYLLKSETGEATVDTEKETLFSRDLNSFTNIMGQVQKGMDNTYLDGYPFARYEERRVLKEPEPVTFDFSDYDINLRGEGNEVYFPLASLSDIYSDLAYHYAAYNGEKIYFLSNKIDPEDFFFNTPYYEPLSRNSLRQADMAEFNYNEFCFAIDKLYGYPGRAYLNDALKEKGLDRALTEEGEAGRVTRSSLRSAEKGKYYFGIIAINILLEDGGHTRFLSEYPSDYPGFYEAGHEFPSYGKDMYKQLGSFYDNESKYINNLVEFRNSEFGKDNHYIKKGDTALIIFNNFTPSYEIWEDYYSGKSEAVPLSDDSIGTLYHSLIKAENDPEVKNVVIDIAINEGGSGDVLVAAESLLTGENCLISEDPLTGEKVEVHYLIDSNFDRKFDEEDRKIKFDKNIGLLTSRVTYSAGNCLASYMKDRGYPVFGEKSGGGSCAVQYMTLPDGNNYHISSHHCRFSDKDGNNVDNGIPVDVELVSENDADFSGLYDLDRLSREMNAFYAEKDPEEKASEAATYADPSSPLHYTTGENITTVSTGNARYKFTLSSCSAIVAGTKADISEAFKTAQGYDEKAKHRYISGDKKIAKVNKKGILTPKKRGETEITCEQKIKGGSWQQVGGKIRLYVQVPVMEKKREVKEGTAGLSAYEFLSGTTYSPTNWRSGNEKVAKVDENGNITILKPGRVNIIAEYGEGKNGSGKKYKTKLKVTK